MTPVRPPMINFKVTVRAACAISACSPLPQPIKVLPPDYQGRESAFGQESAPPTSWVANIHNTANFPFHQTGLSLGF